jgi:predicted Zn-dependent protease with MMP-like domain
VDPELFDSLVDEALEGLPAEFAERLDNIDVVVKVRPSRRQLREMDIPAGDTLLGLYEGVSQTERDSTYGNVLPDRILIFREPILDEADDTCPPEAPDKEFEKVVRDVIRTTVLHEIGHYFGLSDKDLRRLDYD